MFFDLIMKSHQIEPLINQTAKIVKTRNEDVTLKCLLRDEHEVFNKMSKVSWHFFKKLSKHSSWNHLDKNIDYEEIESESRLSLKLSDAAEGGYYVCKIFPYQTNNQTILQIEVSRTFFVVIFGKVFLN